MPGVRTELVFERAEGCPVAMASAGVPGPVTDINWTDGDGETVSEQVTVSDGDDIDGEDLPEFDPVFDYGSQQVYEFDREQSEPCICESIEEALGPVTDVHAADGDLHVTLHASDMGALRDLVADMRDQYGDLSIEYLVRSVDGEDETDLVPVDMRKLTDRQHEVLTTAHEMGYFEYPRDANAETVADALDIQPSTFAEHLAASQRKLLDELLTETSS
jgi:predicted DNA binding protein